MPQPTSAARPKRAGEDFNRTHDNTSKKPRFDYRNPSTLAADAPEDDLILDADVIGKSGSNTKRNAINIDGYESDSDNDNFNARAAEKAKRKDKAAKSHDAEDDDMFAEVVEAGADDDEELTRKGKKRGKDVKFLEAEEIEGQVMTSTSGGKVSDEILLGGKGKGRASKEEDDDESSGDEEERDKLDEEMEDELAAEIGAGGKKKHAPRLDAFNLKDEEEDGRFDESGNYVRKAADPDAVNDNWLDGLSKKDMKKAKDAQEKREEERRRKAMADDALLTSDLLSTLISPLETGESPLEALQRLNRGKPQEKKVPKWKQKKQRNGMDLDEPAENGNGAATDPKEEARREAVEAITGAADALYSRGQLDIYEAERELLMRQYRKETGEDWQPAAEAATAGADGQDGALSQWEYRWSDARDGGEAHGPYDAPTMRAWHDAGYFGEGVEFREVGGSQWSRLLDIS